MGRVVPIRTMRMSDYLHEQIRTLRDAQSTNPILDMNEDDSDEAYNVPVDAMGNPIGVSASGGVAAGQANVVGAVTAPIAAVGNAVNSGIASLQSGLNSLGSGATTLLQYGAIGAVLIVGLMIWVELDRTKGR